MSSPPRLYEPQHCDTVTPPLFPLHHHHPSASSPPPSSESSQVCASSVTVPAPTLIVNPFSLDYDLSPPLDLIVEVRAGFCPPPPPALPLNSMTPRRPANMSCIGIVAYTCSI
ncbi:hypothetical protein DFH09DRAFT_1377611, partial [Mycena vulgaris]